MPEDTRSEKAVALSYKGSGAPKVIARGTGELAKKIIEVARNEGIPIQKNETLVEALVQIDLNHEIPPQLYAAVAEILALIYKLDSRKQQKLKKT
ncbi:EscU/YscU/HrcU family type III secretion system export apparatus switch protein [Desulfitobacterium sp.]|uniref:EscU/YscU/HrcU family type III secretion system export apparatus switch protein n=1 Tax=Desulfitobacterium sp. TaxID=49981 RepID=UPI002B20F856|nr:EscU/YscU/HrcU family type III secretion system export apparatus switch protein [Desulfitobacterium sp.]MEA4902775.1 EscU/YscU/HrcU family type III secretion system export apparatus switch protein [Desulfitobacterium sp.]